MLTQLITFAHRASWLHLCAWLGSEPCWHINWPHVPIVGSLDHDPGHRCPHRRWRCHGSSTVDPWWLGPDWHPTQQQCSKATCSWWAARHLDDDDLSPASIPMDLDSQLSLHLRLASPCSLVKLLMVHQAESGQCYCGIRTWPLLAWILLLDCLATIGWHALGHWLWPYYLHLYSPSADER